MNLIQVKDLKVAYEGRQVFEHLNFPVNEGDYLCILGENGSGKTTLMNCLLGIHNRYSGEIVCNGFLPQQIGWLPQRTEVKRDFPATAFEIILTGFSGKGILGLFYSRAQKKAASNNMQLLEINDLKNRSFRELSGGQQQRVLLCRALCAAERILLLDEPVTGLDPAVQEELYLLIRRLHDSGMTVIMISHDVERALKEATHVLHIGDKNDFYGTVQDYRQILSDKGEQS